MDQRTDREDEAPPSEKSLGEKDENQSKAERESSETASDSGWESFKSDRSKDIIEYFKSDGPSSPEW